MAKQFTTTLVGRRITPIPARTAPQHHMRDELPQGVIYLIHTAYLDEGEPTVVGERIDMKVGKGDEIADAHEVFHAAPQSAKVPVDWFGQLWELLP